LKVGKLARHNKRQCRRWLRFITPQAPFETAGGRSVVCRLRPGHQPAAGLSWPLSAGPEPDKQALCGRDKWVRFFVLRSRVRNMARARKTWRHQGPPRHSGGPRTRDQGCGLTTARGGLADVRPATSPVIGQNEPRGVLRRKTVCQRALGQPRLYRDGFGALHVKRMNQPRRGTPEQRAATNGFLYLIRPVVVTQLILLPLHFHRRAQARDNRPPSAGATDVPKAGGAACWPGWLLRRRGAKTQKPGFGIEIEAGQGVSLGTWPLCAARRVLPGGQTGLLQRRKADRRASEASCHDGFWERCRRAWIGKRTLMLPHQPAMSNPLEAGSPRARRINSIDSGGLPRGRRKLTPPGQPSPGVTMRRSETSRARAYRGEFTVPGTG